MDQLPSLNSIRIFATVARLESYSAAARELRVTTSALSHRIKALEKTLGVSLIRRTNQRIFLTAIGRQYYEQIVPGLAQLAAATSALNQSKRPRVLRISSVPTLAARWLLPRLGRFMSEFPEVRVELFATVNAIEFSKGHFDLGIRYVHDIPTGLRGASLGPNHVFPVCSPKLVKGPFALRTAADLKHHVVMDAVDFPANEPEHSRWRGWLGAARHSSVKAKEEIFLSPRWLMMDAVEKGLGVGLARTLAVADGLAAKKFVCPFGPALPVPATFHVIYSEPAARNPEIVTFVDWITSEAQKSLASVRLPKAR